MTTNKVPILKWEPVDMQTNRDNDASQYKLKTFLQYFQKHLWVLMLDNDIYYIYNIQ